MVARLIYAKQTVIIGRPMHIFYIKVYLYCSYI